MKPVPINGMTLNKELRDKQMTGVGQEGDPMFAVRSNGAQHAVAFHPTQTPISSTDGSTHCLSQGCRAGSATVAVAFDTTQITSPSNYSVPKDGAPCHPLAAGAHPPAIAFGGDVARTLQARHDSSPCADRGMDVVAQEAVQVQWASGGVNWKTQQHRLCDLEPSTTTNSCDKQWPSVA